MTSDKTKLRRSSTEKVVAGVCGGFAERLGWDATLVRFIYVLISIFTAGLPGFIVYSIFWVALPSD